MDPRYDKPGVVRRRRYPRKDTDRAYRRPAGNLSPKGTLMPATLVTPSFPASAFETAQLKEAWKVNDRYSAYFRQNSEDGSVIVACYDGLHEVEAELVPVPLTPEHAADLYYFVEARELPHPEEHALMAQVLAYLHSFVEALCEAGLCTESFHAGAQLFDEQPTLTATLDLLDADTYTTPIAETTLSYLRGRYESNQRRAAKHFADGIRELAR